jgi:hypothetical protein
MKQHRSFKKDMDLLSEAYGRIGGIHMSDLATQAAGHLAAEDGEDHDKTGHLSDRALLDKVKGMGTAGDRLIDAAEERLKKDPDKGLTPPERDALARDAYGDAEKKIARDHEDDESTKKEDRDEDPFRHPKGMSATEKEDRDADPYR